MVTRGHLEHVPITMKEFLFSTGIDHNNSQINNRLFILEKVHSRPFSIGQGHSEHLPCSQKNVTLTTFQVIDL
jgi:hypothetical protein